MNRKNLKKSVAEDELKIAFIYYSFTSFIRQDYEILSNHFDVIKVNYHRKIWDTFKILQAILKSDLSFSWFVGGHTFLAVLFSKIFRKKSIVVAGGGEVAPYMQSTLGWHKKIYMKFALKYADLVLPVSEIISDEILRWWVEPKRMEVVYNGIDVEMFKPLHEKENNLVITVGNVDWWNLKRKGIEMFVRSAKFIPEAHFVVIGKNTNDSIDRLNSIASPNTEFTGFVSDEELLKWYQKSKVYCQLSYYESFGMAPAEAMACECVPVVTDKGALPEVVGDTGFYVPYDDPKATAEAIKKALNSSENLGKKARERIKNMFPIEKREKELVEVMEDLQ
jgi:glycosyltransferase involved in cell wall biosynthesis